MGQLIHIAELSSEFYGTEIKRIHAQILEHHVESGIDECGFNSATFEFFGDGLSDNQAVLCVAEEIGLKVPAYLRNYVVERDGEYRFDRGACIGRCESEGDSTREHDPFPAYD